MFIAAGAAQSLLDNLDGDGIRSIRQTGVDLCALYSCIAPEGIPEDRQY